MIADLFEKFDIVQNTMKANKANKTNRIKKNRAVIVNEEDYPEYIVDQIKAMDAGVAQRITRNGYIVAHSVFS